MINLKQYEGYQNKTKQTSLISIFNYTDMESASYDERVVKSELRETLVHWMAAYRKWNAYRKFIFDIRQNYFTSLLQFAYLLFIVCPNLISKNILS